MERRRFPRLDARLETELTYVTGTTEAPVTQGLITSNVSAGGICLSSDKPLEPGAFVGLTIRLPDASEPLSLFAEVVWCDTRAEGGYELGLRFLAATEGSVEDLNRYLEPQVR